VQVQSFDSVDLLQYAFVAGRCDGWSSDLSQLKGLRSAYLESEGGPDGLVIFEDEIFSKEPLAPAVVDGDSRWVQFLGGENADGETLDPGLGIPIDFAHQVVAQVGNYGEIFDNNLSTLELERGLNALWTDGGLQYAPPYRRPRPAWAGERT
jgi:general L-amino acid transport system substrate-binding protein